MPKNRRFSLRGQRIVLIAATLMCLVAITLLARDVSREIVRLNSARSDNVQWTLSQIEVEFLEISIALRPALDDGQVDLSTLRRRFDVFYSRVKTVRESRLFADLRRETDFSRALGQVDAFVQDTVRTIDAEDSVLMDASPLIVDRIDALRPDVRALANSGLNYFAQLADAQRANFSRALTRLGTIVAVLVLVLSGLIFFLAKLNAKIRRRQRQAREANARMTTITSTSLDGVIVANTDGHILEFNKAAEDIFGHIAADVMGKSIGDVIVPDHFKAGHDAGMERMRKNGEKRVVGHGRVQLEAVRKNGEIFPVELAIQSAVTEDEELFIAFLRDISKAVADEAELVETRDRALASEKAKSEFLAVMSHEIRTPLNGLLGNLSLLRDTEITKDQKDYVRNMDTSGRLLLSHVTDVLDITKYDAGKVDQNMRPMRLDPFVQDLVDNQEGPAQEQGTSLKWAWIGEAVGPVNSDPDLLQPILLNLISNAVKFTPNGSVDVEIEKVDATANGPIVEFRVIDTGQGISPEILTTIFDDFVTGNISLNRATGGTGLGLGIARRYAEALGGTIEAESIDGEGSIFTFRVPFKSVAESVLAADIEREDDQPSMNILVVEDNEINRQVVREMLRKKGHSVTEANNGQDGVALAQSAVFDLILMDISMPVMDGREATRHIRSGGGPSASAPIVALTANVMEDDRTAYINDGMNDVLIKPLSRPALSKLLGEIRSSDADVDVDADQFTELTETLGKETAAKMIAKFLVEGDAFFDGWDGFDQKTMAAQAHKFAGSAAMFGATELSGELKRLEFAAKADAPTDYHSTRRNLHAVWTKTKDRLSTLTSL